MYQFLTVILSLSLLIACGSKPQGLDIPVSNLSSISISSPLGKARLTIKTKDGGKQAIRLQDGRRVNAVIDQPMNGSSFDADLMVGENFSVGVSGIGIDGQKVGTEYCPDGLIDIRITTVEPQTFTIPTCFADGKVSPPSNDGETKVLFAEKVTIEVVMPGEQPSTPTPPATPTIPEPALQCTEYESVIRAACLAPNEGKNDLHASFRPCWDQVVAEQGLTCK